MEHLNLRTITLGTTLLSLSLHAQTVLWNDQAHPDDLATLSAAFSGDGAKVISGSECDSARVRIWDVTTGNIIWDHVIGTGYYCANGVQMSANGNYIGIAEETGTLFIYDNTQVPPTPIHTINVGTGLYNLDFSADNSRVAVDGDDGTLRIYDVVTGNLLISIPANNGSLYSLDLDPTSDLVAAGGEDNTVRIWDGSNGSLLATLNGHTDDITSVRFSADGSHLVTASVNGEIKVWMPMMGNMWMLHIGYTAPEDLHQIDISDDLAYVIAGGSDSTYVFETFTGDQRAVFNVADGGAVLTVDFQPGSYNAVTGTESGRVVYWGLNDVLGVADLGKAELALTAYPNPATDRLRVELPAASGAMTVKLFDTHGRLVLAGRSGVANTWMDLSSLPAATYLLRVETEKGVAVRSITKQ